MMVRGIAHRRDNQMPVTMAVLEKVSTSLSRATSLELPEAVQIAVLIPCYNEEHSVGAVVAGFRQTVPQSRIYLYDNNSQDRTAAIGRAAGAIVRDEPLQGKGNVVARMFADI